MYLIQMLTLWEEEYIPVAVAGSFDEGIRFIEALRVEMLRQAPTEPEKDRLSAEQVNNIDVRMIAIPHARQALMPLLAKRVHRKLF